MSIAAILVSILGVILLLLLLIIVCPLRLTLRAELQPGANQVSAELSLVYSLIKAIVNTDLRHIQVIVKLFGLPVPIYRRKLKSERAKTAPQKVTQKKVKKTKPSHQRSINEWLQFGEGVVTRIKPVIHFERMQADLTVGLATPDQTGMLLGAFYFMRGALNWGSGCRLTPDFSQKRCEGWAQVSLFLRLVRLIPVGLFIFKAMRKPISTGG